MKAIMIVDMPKIDENTKNGCRNCRYARKMMTLSEEYLCSITEQSAYVYDMKCPLKPMPQNRELEESGNSLIDDCKEYYIDGWNDCLDEILGEEE